MAARWDYSMAADMGPGDRAGESPAAVRPVGQVHKRCGKLDLEPSLARVPPYRLVAPRLAGLAVRSDEQPRRLPVLTPLLFAPACCFQVVAVLRQLLATTADAQGTGLELL